MKLLQSALMGALQVYRWVSPAKIYFFGPLGRCRFHPTCSQYAMEAVQRFGPIQGVWLAVRRLLRCHPWGGCGHDPVPEKPQPFPVNLSPGSKC